MSIPIINFLRLSKKFWFYKINNNLYINDYRNFNFEKVENQSSQFINTLKLDKNKPQNLIKFNVGNEFAVEMFKKKLINYTIFTELLTSLFLNLYYPLKNTKDINYHEKLKEKYHNI